MYNVTLSQLRTLAQQRCHMENSQVIPTAEWNQNINDSGTELHGLLAQAFGAKYAMKVQPFSLQPSTDTYQITVDIVINTSGAGPLAINTKLTGVTSGATAIVRNVIGISGNIVHNLSDVVGTFVAGETVNGSVSGTVIAFLDNGAGTSTQKGIGAADFMQLQGLDVQVSGARWLPIREFKMSERGYFQLPGYNMNVLGPIFAYRFQGQNLVFAPIPSGAYNMRLYYTPTWTQLINDADVVDAVDGWQEIIVLDCCIKAMVKQDLPSDGFMMQKQAMIQRINALKQQRDSSTPPRIADTSSDSTNDWLNTFGRTYGI